MDVKSVFKVTVLFSFVTGYFCISVSFCSEETIKDYFDDSGKESALKLDGSNRAVPLSPTMYAQISCTCVVTPTSPLPDKLRVGLEYLVGTTSLKTCNKSLDVVGNNGNKPHTFGCASDVIEVQADDMKAGIQFKLNLFGNPGSTEHRVVDDMYSVYVMPDPGTVLTVRCYAVTSSAASSTSTGSDSSTTSPSTSTRAFIKTGSVDTSVVVGVVIGLGLFFLVFISCLLVYIARRRKRRNITGIPNLPTQQQQQSRNGLSRTLTNFYNRMKVNRSLPRIPASIRNITRLKMMHSNGSGLYDSIKSDRNNEKKELDKQESQVSDCSYLEPATIATISQGVTRNGLNSSHPDEKPKNMKLSNRQVRQEHLPPAKEKMAIEDAKQTNSSNAMYIHPVSKTESFEDSDYHDDKVDSHNMYENSLPSHTYVNAGEAQSVRNDTKEREFETEPCDPEYMKMYSCGDTNDKQVKENKITDIKDTSKEELTGEDCEDYLRMDVSYAPKDKRLLQRNECPFPGIIEFTTHGRNSTDPVVYDVNHMADSTENQSSERQNVKNKRYVKDKTLNRIDSEV